MLLVGATCQSCVPTLVGHLTKRDFGRDFRMGAFVELSQVSSGSRKIQSWWRAGQEPHQHSEATTREKTMLLS